MRLQRYASGADIADTCSPVIGKSNQITMSPNDNSFRLYSLCAKSHQCTPGLTVNVSAKIRNGTITEIDSLNQLPQKHQQSNQYSLAQITESCDLLKSPNQIAQNQITYFQIKSFVLKSNHHRNNEWTAVMGKSKPWFDLNHDWCIQSWFKSNHDLDLPITAVHSLLSVLYPMQFVI